MQIIPLNTVYKGLDHAGITADSLLSGMDKNLKTFSSFTCENCNQKYTLEVLHLAVSLYGIFFLTGGDNKNGYWGITCPRCLQTILAKGDRSLVKETRDDLLDLEMKGKLLPAFNKGLSYNSSVVYSLDHIPTIKKYDIHSYLCSIGKYPELVEDGLIYQLDDYTGYLCSYIFGINLDSFPQKLPPQGEYFLVLFFRENQIEDLVKLEESTGLKIFPRYKFKNILTKATEKFCWDNYLYLAQLKENKKQSIEFENWQREQCEKEGVDFDALADNYLRFRAEGIKIDDDFFSPEHKIIKEREIIEKGEQFQATRQRQDSIQDSIDQYQKQIEDNVSLTSDLFEILTFDVADFKTQLPTSYEHGSFLNRGFANMYNMYMSKNPLSDKEIAQTSELISQTEFSECIYHEEYGQIARESKAYIEKGYVQGFLKENAGDFAQKYIDLAQKRNFSFADFFSLRKEYLQKLSYAIECGKREESPYAFFREGNSWTIIFDGQAIRGLKKIGYSAIHKLISHKNQEVHILQLSKMLDLEKQFLDKFIKHSKMASKVSPAAKSSVNATQLEHDTENNYLELNELVDNNGLDSQYKNEMGLSNINQFGEDALLDKDALRDLFQFKEKLMKQIKDPNSDNSVIQAGEQRLDELNAFLIECRATKGKSRTFRDQNLKNIKHTITLGIRRAIMDLGRIAEAEKAKNQKGAHKIKDAHEHFKKALFEIPDKTRPCYRPPNEDIDWRT